MSGPKAVIKTVDMAEVRDRCARYAAEPRRPALARSHARARAPRSDARRAQEMQTDAIEIAQEAIGSYMMEKDMANFIKREFDKKYQPTWHVIIGKSWGALVTHATKCAAAPRAVARARRAPRRVQRTLTLATHMRLCVALMPTPRRNFIYFYLGDIAILIFKSG